MPTPETFFFALGGGVLPALLWLWFWLQEDCLHPEPQKLIVRTFFAGMFAVPLVLPVEQFIQTRYAWSALLVVLLWACSEEIFKLIAAGLSAFDTKDYDEPIDAVIYMITAALGFSAMENVFFLITSISNTPIMESVVTGNLRFIGATLLHVLSSGVIGFFMGITFYKKWLTKKISLVIGTISAVLMHTIFNFYIMKSQGASIFIVFCFVWVATLLLIVGFEKVKKIQKTP